MVSAGQQPDSLNIQLLVDSIPALIHTAKPDGYLDYFNKPWLDYLGVTLDKVAGWNWTAFIHPEDVDGIVTQWRACLLSGENFEYETRVRRANGDFRWMFHRKVPLRDSNGNIVKWYGSSLDIDERKTANEQLRRNSEELQRSEFYLAEGQRLAHMGSWAFDPDGFSYWSPELFRVHGLDPASKLPNVQEYLDRVHPHDRDFMADLIKGMSANASSFDTTKRIVRPNGEVRYIRCVGAPVLEDQSLKKYVGSAIDVTEHELLTQELRRREAYLTEAQRLSQTGSFGCKLSTGEMFWSDETFRIYGYDRSTQPAVERVLERVHPEDRVLVQERMDQANRDEKDCSVECRLLLPDGSVKHVCIVAHASKNESGTTEFIGAVTDVTARKLTEGELRRSKAHLADAQTLSRTGSIGMEVSTKRIFWSEEAARIYGYPPGTVPTPDLILQRSHPDDVGLLIDALERAAQGVSDINFEHRLLMPDGSMKHLHDLTHCYRDEAGNEEIVGAIMDITERKVAEEAVRRSETYLAEAQRLSHTGSFGWKPSSEEIVWSDETYRIFEYDPAEKPAVDMVLQRTHPQDRALLQHAIENLSKSGIDFEDEYRLLLPDGRVKHVYSIAHAVQNASGDREIVGAVTDITESKGAEEALRSSEADLLEAQRLSHTGSWRHDVLTGIVTISPEVHRIFDIRPGEGALTAGFFFGRIHPEDRPIEAQNYERANLAKTDLESDYRIVLPDGSIKHVHNIGHPVLNESGDIGEFVGTVIDITERKRAEEELRRSEMELRQLVDLVPQLIAVYGPNRERLYTNQTALDYLGISLDEWQHKKFGASAHPDDSERLKNHADRALSSGAPDELELRLRKSDGSYRWFLARLNPLRDEHGKITRWYFTGTDIDDRKQAEDRLRTENVALREEIDKVFMFDEIVGTSPALQTVLSRISKVARGDSTVLITGETGTGKELVARAIHRRSNRRSRAFVSVNCAAVPRDLIASELFGHEKGAFTGATQQRLGRFELANGGTLFLDEVGELPPETQIALLRVLQEHEFERVGGSRRIHGDVRVIAATNRDLQAAIRAGLFRSDLFYRLHVFPIAIPPLRERQEDISLLIDYFIVRYARKAGKNIRGVSKKTLELLQSYPWPGNIRELQNVIERSVILCDTEIFSIDESWLPREPFAAESTNQVELSEKLLAQEKNMIEAALKESRGRVFGPDGDAAKLGIPRSTLESKIRSLKIDKNRFRTRPSI